MNLSDRGAEADQSDQPGWGNKPQGAAQGDRRLVNLRYLGFRDTSKESLTKTIKNLSCLQFLDVRNDELEWETEILRQVWEIETLRQVFFPMNAKLPDMVQCH